MPWHAKSTGGYARDTQEAQDNAVMFASVLQSVGWSLESICAALGNIQGEGAMNPWRWDSDTYFPTQAEAIQDQAVYGLFNYTPFTGYMNLGANYPGFGINYNDGNDNNTGSIKDGDAQALFMNDDILGNIVNSPYGWSANVLHYDAYRPNFPNNIDIEFIYGVGEHQITTQEFIAGTGYTLDQLTLAFELAYERVGYQYAYGAFLFRAETAQYYYDYLSTVPIPPFITSSKMKWIYWLKPRWKRGF